jgi:hypothetical protein
MSGPLTRAVALALMLVLASGTAPRAQSVEPELHRVEVPPGEALSTKGAFSVHMPVPFNDFTVSTVDPNVGETSIHVVAGQNGDGVTYYVAKIVTAKMKPFDFDGLLADFRRDPENKLDELKRESRDGAETMTVTVVRPLTRTAMRMVNTQRAVFQMVIDAPNSYRGPLTAEANAFFNSLQIGSR